MFERFFMIPAININWALVASHTCTLYLQATLDRTISKFIAHTHVTYLFILTVSLPFLIFKKSFPVLLAYLFLKNQRQ